MDREKVIKYSLQLLSIIMLLSAIYLLIQVYDNRYLYEKGFNEALNLYQNNPDIFYEKLSEQYPLNFYQVRVNSTYEPQISSTCINMYQKQDKTLK